MKVNITIEDKRGVIRIPLTRREIRAMFSLPFMIEADWKVLKLNKIDKDIETICRKFHHLENDIMADGRCYEWGEKIGKHKRTWFKLSKKKFWMVKKPKWRKKYET